jgi:glycosyltransferase involved in cell wall biosynthesis
MNDSAESQPFHRFVLPDLNGPPTGGTVFNASLLQALRELGESVEWSTLDEAHKLLTVGHPSIAWIDSLYVTEMRKVCRCNAGHNRLGLLVHYLPSLLRFGGDLTWEDLGLEERYALQRARAFVVTSRFAKTILERLGVADRSIAVVEPGRLATGLITHVPQTDWVRAVIVANLAPNKGVLPFLQGLAKRVRSSDQFQLRIIGNKSVDVPYALDCSRFVAENAELSRRIVFEGLLSPVETISRMTQSNLLVSASPMETYGMVLAEGLTLGLPILAHFGGNIEHLVLRHKGNQVLANAEQLAEAFIGLCRDPQKLAARADDARRFGLEPRTWAAAAQDFIARSQVHRKE